MRINFKNLGQAELYLKTCRQTLTKYLVDKTNVRIPTQRVRNAFCQGFGYSSYDELKRLLSVPPREFNKTPSEEDFIGTFIKAFTLAFDVAAECGWKRKEGDQLIVPTLARSTVSLLNQRGSASELYTRSDAENVEELSDSGRANLNISDEVEDKDEFYRAQINSMVAGRRALATFFSDAPKAAAIEHFNIVINAYPDNLLARAMRAECRVFEIIDLEEAVTDCRHILGQQPDRHRILFVLGRALILLKRYDEAIGPLERARKLSSDDTATLCNLALAYGAGPKDYKRGLRHARRAARLEPENTKAHFMILTLLKNAGEEEKLSRYSLYLNDHHPQVFMELLYLDKGPGQLS